MRFVHLFFVFMARACSNCAHFRPFEARPNYEDMGKCALNTDAKYPGILGYAEGARTDPSKCGTRGAWYKPLYEKKSN